MRQVVRAEAEKCRCLGYFASAQCSARQLDHRTDLIRHALAAFSYHRFRRFIDDSFQDIELTTGGDQRHHDFRVNRNTLGADVAGRQKNSPRLHFVNFGVGYAQSTTTVAQHRVRFVQISRARA